MATIHGTDASEILTGGPDADQIYGEGSGDGLYGLGGNDRLSGGAGEDNIMLNERRRDDFALRRAAGELAAVLVGVAAAVSNWTDRFAELRDVDDEKWDTLHEALAADWKREYLAGFIATALERGWDRENAEAWSTDIVDRAFIERRTVWPRLMARDDVLACERETANA